MKKLLSFILLSAGIVIAAAGQEKFKAEYSCENITEGRLTDTGELQIDGKVYSSVKISPNGKEGSCLEFNGVDGAVFFPVGFSGGNNKISMWICPASNPAEDTVKERLDRVMKKDYLTFWDKYHIAYKNKDGKPVWGVLKNRKSFQPRNYNREYIFGIDSPFSGARMGAYLKKTDGKLYLPFAFKGPNGRNSYPTLCSKSVLWQKGLWSKIEIQFDAAKSLVKLIINDKLEASSGFFYLPQRMPYPFTLGASKQLGMPFYGKIDSFSVTSSDSIKSWIFPEGRFVLKGIKQAENVYLPYPFKLIDEKAPGLSAGVRKTESGNILDVNVQKTGSGIQTIVHVMSMQTKYSIGVEMEGPGNGKAELLVSRSKNPASAFLKKTLETNGKMKRYDFSNVITGKNCSFFLFLKFNTPGKYSIKEVNIY